MPCNDGIHVPCACNSRCGDVAETDDDEYAICKGLRQAPDPPLVEIIVVRKDAR